MRYKLFALLTLAVLISGCTKKEPTRITILHWNDFHSANVPHTMVNDNGDTLTLGGIANLAGYLEHYREELKPTIEVNSGDEFQGTPISAFTKGLSQVKLLNVVKPVVFTVGNHEFDYGAEDDSVMVEEIGSDLEIIVGGHSHTVLNKPLVVNGVNILRAH